MADGEVEQAFKKLLGKIGDRLKSRGFSKRGNAFRRLVSGNAMIIEVQRSQSSTRDSVRFTLNAGVISGRLLDEYGPDVSRAGAMHAHLRQRIGEFLIEPSDKWWELDTATSLDDLFAELAPLLDQAARFLIDHSDDTQLIVLWESGRSPGLTDGQRKRHLRELRAA